MSPLIINALFRLRLGEIVLDLIMEFFPEIINVEFTAKMEKEP